MQVAEQVGTLEEVTAKLAERRSKVAGLQREFEAAVQEQASLKTLRESFLVVASIGDKAAIAHIEELERRQVVTGRTIEGLQIRLQTAESELHEVELEHAGLAQAAATEERRKVFEEKRAKAKKLGWNHQALVRLTKRNSFEIAEFYRLEVEYGGCTDAEKAILTSDLREAAELPNDWNEKAQRAPAPFLPLVTIQPVAAPDELKHLEILR